MSAAGSPGLDVTRLRDHGAADLRVAVVAAQWHEKAMAGLLDGAMRALRDLGISSSTVLRVPGAFELPVAAKRLAVQGHDAVVALGVVVRGSTPHFEYVCQAATVGLTQVAIDTGIPVGFGVLTCENIEQAYDRSGLLGSTEDKGYEAAIAAVATAIALSEIGKSVG